MKRLHPATLIVGFLPRIWEAVKAFLPALAFSFLSGKQDFTEIVIAGMGVLGGFGIIATYLTTTYGIEGKELVWKSGWLFKRDRRIALDHVHNVNLRQGLLERLFKVVTVEVETAAGQGAELRLQSLSMPHAEALREDLLAGVVRSEAEPEVKDIYRVSPQDLWLGALTENEGARLILVLMAAVGSIAILQAVATIATLRTFIPMQALWIVGGTVVLLILFGGWIYGAVSYALKFGGFAVRSEPGCYRIAHGVLSKMQYTLRTERIEYAAVSATIWQKMIHRATVRVGTAGTFGEHGALMPLALMVEEREAERVAAGMVSRESLRDLPWQPFPRYYLVVTVVHALIGLSMLAALWWAAGFLPGRGPAPDIARIFLLVTIIGTVASTADKLFSYRISGYAVGEHVVAVRSGFLTRRTTMIPINRIELASTSDAPWWRMRGVTSLTVQGMVHSVQIPMLPIEEAQALCRRTATARAPMRISLGVAPQSDPA